MPLAIAVFGAIFFMNNLTSAKSSFRDQLAITKNKHTWIMSFIYIGTFGSFIGYSAAFPLLIKTQFPTVTIAIAFLGPLVGSLSRPLGGLLADKVGGAIVTFWNFIAMGAATIGVLYFVGIKDFTGFVGMFLILFVTTGVGNGSTYRMIPSIFREENLRKAEGQGRSRPRARIEGCQHPERRRARLHRRDRRMRRLPDPERLRQVDRTHRRSAARPDGLPRVLRDLPRAHLVLLPAQGARDIAACRASPKRACDALSFTSPRLRGEVGRPAALAKAGRVSGDPHSLRHTESPLTHFADFIRSVPSPRQRGEGQQERHERTPCGDRQRHGGGAFRRRAEQARARPLRRGGDRRRAAACLQSRAALLVLAGEVPSSDIELKPSAWWRDRGITLRYGCRASAIDTEARNVTLADGELLAFSRLVFATGSQPIRPAIPGMTLPGVITFRDINDIWTIWHRAGSDDRVVVIGGGLLGLEAAYGVAKSGARVTLLHLMDRLMERQLDAHAARMLQRAVEAMGIEVILQRRHRGDHRQWPRRGRHA